MLKFITKLLKKKKKNNVEIENNDVCKTCIWWKSAEANNLTPSLFSDIGYCDIHKRFTNENYSCKDYKVEKFHADEFSTQTPELNLDYDLEIDKIEKMEE